MVLLYIYTFYSWTPSFATVSFVPKPESASQICIVIPFPLVISVFVYVLSLSVLLFIACQLFEKYAKHNQVEEIPYLSFFEYCRSRFDSCTKGNGAGDWRQSGRFYWKLKIKNICLAPLLPSGWASDVRATLQLKARTVRGEVTWFHWQRLNQHQNMSFHVPKFHLRWAQSPVLSVRKAQEEKVIWPCSLLSKCHEWWHK